MVKEIAALSGVYDAQSRETTNDLIRRLATQQVLSHEVADIFHAVRRSGNEASHGFGGSVAEARENDIQFDDIIIRNSAQCLSCGDEIESMHSHDFRTCSCGQLSVDGGRQYLRRAYKPGALWRDTSITRAWEDGE